MTTFAVTSVNSLFCHASTCFRIGSKLRCIRSTPTEMQSISENDFECLARTGVKSPAKAMFEHTKTQYPPGPRQTLALVVRVAQPLEKRHPLRACHLIPWCDARGDQAIPFGEIAFEKRACRTDVNPF